MFSLKVSNFRSFKEEFFDFRRINILIGENSSGKSSLLKLLLALKQTIHGLDRRDINLLLSGNEIDLGNYQESVYYHNENLPIKLIFTFGDDFYRYYINSFTSEIEDESEIFNMDKLHTDSDIHINYFKSAITTQTTLDVSINKELDSHESLITIISNPEIGIIKIKFEPKEIDAEKRIHPHVKPKSIITFDRIKDKTLYSIPSIEFSKEGFFTVIDGYSFKTQIYKFLNVPRYVDDIVDSELPEEELKGKQFANQLFHEIGFLLVSQNYLRAILNKIEYVNPISTKPLRFYFNRDAKNINSIANIEDFVDFLSKPSIKSSELTEELIFILKKFGIAESIDIVKNQSLPVKELRIKIKDLMSNITDVGYGVSLQLPIIMKALLSERIPGNEKTILLIEQPEVHLHPKLQAEFIDTLLSIGCENIYIIETHSEHIVRKLQVIVKEKKYGIKSSDVSINYLRRIDTKTEKSSHTIEDDGFLNPPFPSGFFDNSYLLAKDLLN